MHFIGKDIIYFHTLFWPAMLKAAGFASDGVNVHGMLELRRREDVEVARPDDHRARAWLDSLDPSYSATTSRRTSGPALDDIEFSLDELRNRVNSGLVNNIGNLANRAASRCDAGSTGGCRSRRGSPRDRSAAGWLHHAGEAGVLGLNYREAVKKIEALGHLGERVHAVGRAVEGDQDAMRRAQADVSLVVNVAKALATMLSPVVPRFAKIFHADECAPGDLRMPAWRSIFLRATRLERQARSCRHWSRLSSRRCFRRRCG